MIIDSPIISGSYAASGSLNQLGNVVISGSLTVTGSIIGTASFATTASNAVTASYLSGYVSPFPFTGSAIISGSLDVTGSLKVTGSITSTGTITAQTLVVQTVSSSVIYSSGSNVFGNDLANTQRLTGSVLITGSLAVNGSNAILTNQTSSMSASYALNATSASYAANATTASYANNSTSASYSNNSTSASYALTASFSLNVPVTSSYANNANSASYAATASFVTTAQTASFVATAQTASYVLNAVSSSFATSASQALTASYLSGYVSPFPFTGSAIISGSLTVTGSVAVSNLSGSGVRYLVADESGSITAQSASAALKSTQAFTSTAGQTTFAVANGYSTGYVDVFINGSKLATAEFTDTSGTNIVLATGSFSGDIVEVVKYTPAAGVTNNVLRQLTTFTASAGQTVFSASYTPGLLDIFYNGSRLSPADFTANNGTFFTLATGSAANDILDVLVYSYQVGAFSGIGGVGVVNQLSYFNTTSSITGSNSFTVSGDTLVGTASYASNANLLDGLDSSVFTLTSSFAAQTASFTAFTSSILSYTASQNILNGTYATTGSNTFAGIQTINSNLVVTGSITAQTLVVQTITSSVDFVTGSTRFGSLSSNTHVFTGSMSVSGSGNFSSSVSINSSAANVIALDLSANSTGGVRQRLLNQSGSGLYNFQIGSNITTNNAFEIIPSTTTDGTTFSTAAFKILNTGAATFSSSISVATFAQFNATTLRLGNDSNSGYNSIAFQGDSADGYNKIFAGSSTNDGLYIAAKTGQGIRCWVNGSSLALFINSAGKVAISAPTLSDAFTVQGASNYWTSILTSGTTTSQAYGLYVKAGTNASDVSFLIQNTSGTDILRILGTGATTFTNTSSALSVVAITSPPTGGNVNLTLQSNSSGNTAYGGLNVVSSTGKAAYLTCGDNSFAANNYYAQASYVTLAGTAGAAMKFRVNADDNAGITISTAGTITFNAYGSGTLTSSPSGVISASDGRYKTKTRSITNALDAIMQLNPTYYRWKEDSEFHTEYEELGFIAQEVASVIPAASPEPEQENRYKNYSDRAIIAMLTKAIQELQEKLERNNIN
jgi:hypothetical protein